MAIGVSCSLQHLRLAVFLTLGLSLLAVPSWADEIKKKDGTTITGQVLGCSNGQVMVQSRSSTGGVVKLPYFLSDIDSISMPPPPDVVKLKGAEPAAAVAGLEPRVAQFAGLPADWVVEAMAQLAEAYSGLNQSDKALALYGQIDTLYPGSKYHPQAVAGKALESVKQGKVDEALAMVQPIIEQANKNLAPSQTDGGLYATVFLVYGQAKEAQKKLPEALEAYLTVKTMFYQNPTLAEKADLAAKKLRDANPGLGVD